MQPFFTPPGEEALRGVMQRRPILAFDFDGTLAPIVAHPDDVKVPDVISRGLARLARRHPVAIITGRAVADVRPRLGFTPQYVIGNHGAEDPESTGPAISGATLDPLRAQIELQAGALREAGVEVEDKDFSLALHYRRAADPQAAQVCIERLLEGLDAKLGRFGGKCVVNIVAAGLPDKGDALVDLMRRAQVGSAVFVGDDVNDEAVFERAEPHWLTLRIGHDPQSRAMFFLENNDALARVLERMLALNRNP